jgi:hypothetical protein
MDPPDWDLVQPNRIDCDTNIVRKETGQTECCDQEHCFLLQISIISILSCVFFLSFFVNYTSRVYLFLLFSKIHFFISNKNKFLIP